MRGLSQLLALVLAWGHFGLHLELHPLGSDERLVQPAVRSVSHRSQPRHFDPAEERIVDPCVGCLRNLRERTDLAAPAAPILRPVECGSPGSGPQAPPRRIQTRSATSRAPPVPTR